MNTIQLDAQAKTLEIQEKQMKRLESEKDEVFRIYKNASKKGRSGKRPAFQSFPVRGC